jgi:hypothetical protein
MYTNWKGETSKRHCIIESIGVGRTSWHNETDQWFLNGYDLDKQARRSYTIADIQIHTMEAC